MAASTASRCCSHFSRCATFGSENVTAPSATPTNVAGAYTARVIPRSAGRTVCSQTSDVSPVLGAAGLGVAATDGAASGAGSGCTAAGRGGSCRSGAPAERGASGGRIGGSCRRGRSTCRSGRHAGGNLLLEAVQASEERTEVRGDRVGRQLHRGHLEQDARVRGVAHLAQHLAEAFDRPHERGRAQPAGLVGERVDVLTRQLHELGRHQRQEPVAHEADQLLGQRARVATDADRVRHHRQRPARVVIDERLDELVERNGLDDVAADARHQLERRQGVARRTAALAQHRVERGVADLEAGVVGDPAHVLGQHVRRQQVELQVLRAAADGVADTSAGRWWRARTRRAAAAPRASSAAPPRPAFESMCTSSRMYTLWRPGVPSDAFSMRSRIASTPLLLAASSSCTS